MANEGQAEGVLGLAGGARFEGVPDLLTALRGRQDSVRLAVRRHGADVEIDTPITPSKSPLLKEAVVASGMLIEQQDMADAEASTMPMLQITHIKRGEAAELAGLRVGDMIDDVNGRRFDTVRDLHAWLSAQPEGEAVKLLIRRRAFSATRRTSGDYLRLEVALDDVTLLQARR